MIKRSDILAYDLKIDGWRVVGRVAFRWLGDAWTAVEGECYNLTPARPPALPEAFSIAQRGQPLSRQAARRAFRKLRGPYVSLK